MLDKPIIILDIETTGLNIYNDRIVQIATHKVFPDGTTEDKSFLINPMMKISKEASDIHHITDEKVIDKPVFARIANNFFKYIKDDVIVTFNGDHFDIPMLAEEFYRCGIIFPIIGETKFIDSITIERLVNSHKLTETYKRYTGLELIDAHDALHDCKATGKVLEGQLKNNEHLPNTIDGLIDFLKPKIVNTEVEYLDIKQLLYLRDGKIYWNFGKHRDKPIDIDKSYVDWFLKGEFPIHSKLVVKKHFNFD